MAIKWPAALRTPTIDGYGVQPQGRVRRTEVRGGPPRFKRTNPNASINVSVRWVFTPAEYETFSQTLRTALNDGERAVLMPLLVERAALTEYTCYFVDTSAGFDGVSWIVTGTLEVLALPFPNIDPGLFNDQIDGGIASNPSTGGPIDGGTATAPSDPANTINVGGPENIP